MTGWREGWAMWGQTVHDGGWIMWPLVAATLVLWAGLGWRAMSLRRGSRESLRALLHAYLAHPDSPSRGVIDEAARRAAVLILRAPTPLRGHLDEHLGELEERLGQLATLTSSIVMVAPLTGLLGTVSGMIETFDSLADMSLFSQSGGIAGGISQALITTQMGLAVAIPGLVLGQLLARRQRLLSEEIEALKALACATAASQQEAT